MVIWLLDISNHQGDFNLAQAAAEGYSAIICKATEGVTFRDGWFDRYIPAIRTPAGSPGPTTSSAPVPAPSRPRSSTRGSPPTAARPGFCARWTTSPTPTGTHHRRVRRRMEPPDRQPSAAHVHRELVVAVPGLERRLPDPVAVAQPPRRRIRLRLRPLRAGTQLVVVTGLRRLEAPRSSSSPRRAGSPGRPST